MKKFKKTVVVPLKTTNEERLQLVNIQLRRELLEARLENQGLFLDQEWVRVFNEISARLEVNVIKDHTIDLDSGIITKL